jgi:hypothetical protein
MKVSITMLKGDSKRILCENVIVENGFIQFKEVKQDSEEYEQLWIASSSVGIVCVEKE